MVFKCRRIVFILQKNGTMRFFITPILFLLISTTGYSQLKVSSLPELLKYADKQSPVALQTNLLPRMAKQDVNIQTSALYPKVNVFGSGDYYPIIATQVIPAEVLGGAPGTYLKA